MKKRAKFHAHGANKLKTYRRRFTDYQVRVRAEISRQARLRNRTIAELAFEEILKEQGVSYEKEKIFQNGDRWVLTDFFIPRRNLAIEIDGNAHAGQADYDRGRTEWLREKGIETVRFSNNQVLKTPEIVKEELTRILDDESKTPSQEGPYDAVAQEVHS